MRKDFKWLVYGQLGTFMWHKKADPNRVADPKGHYIADKTVIYADNLLRRLAKARECGADTVLFDIGEAIQYPSHPELWIDGCLDAQKARALVGRMKDMGYEVIPSLNFSTDHHHWLCQYSRMISTPDYYRVCEDVIRDTWEICGHPAVFHLGYDEEDANCTFSHAKDYPNLVYVRQGALYWHDLAWFCDVCRKLGSRPSFWLDKQRRPGYSHETFVKNVGKDVLLTPWDYTSVYEGNTLPKVTKTLDGMVRLADAGYDMIPVGSNWILPAKRTPERQTTRDNIPNLFAWSKKHLNPDHFAGFGVAPWAGVSEVGNPAWFEAAELLRDVKVGDEAARSGKGTQSMNINRRQFALGSAALALSPTAFAQGLFRVPDGVKYRSALLHLGMNMWGGYRAPGEPVDPDLKYGKSRCLFDEGVWRRTTALMQKRRFNHAVIDLGGGVELQSHPELTLPGSFTPQQMRDEVARLSSMGIEAVPKLNFSACHDAWLGIYERMLSTPKYYRVVEDVIADACEMFGNPRTFHIGLDEEDGVHGAKDPVMAVRCGELWWHDFEFLLKTVERHGAQPIFFSGSAWYRNKEEFFRRVPKSVILNAGSYGSFTSKEEWLAKLRQEYGKIPRLKQKMNKPYQFREYADRGYRLLTCVSNWVNVADKTKYPKIEFGEKFPRNRESIACIQRYIASEMPDANIVGGMVAPWTMLDQKHEDYWRDAINNLADSCEELGWRS